MTLAARQWICTICRRTPLVSIELECPACNTKISESFNVEFTPTGATGADHDSHIAAEQKFMRNQQQYQEHGAGRFAKDIPLFFKGHIKLHEDFAFKAGASSRDGEIRKRIDELNKRAESIVAELTMDILLKRQRECEHDFERRWLPAADSGKVNLLCTGCFKVLNVKFVGTSTQHGESIGLKIVTEK